MLSSPLQAQKGEDARGYDDRAGNTVHPVKFIGVEPLAENGENAHHEQPPQHRAEEDTEDKDAGGKDAPLDPGEPESGKDCGKGKDGHGVSHGQEKRGRVQACVFFDGPEVITFQGRICNHRLDAQNAQKRAAYKPEENVMADEKIRYKRQAESSHEPVDGVGRRRAHSGKESSPPPEHEHMARAEDADGAGRGRDDEADDESLEKRSSIHIEKVGAIVLNQEYFDN
jgi:hypothetical protein